MDPRTCFCGRPAQSFQSSSPTDEKGDWETEIYCTRTCALRDSLRALTARQEVGGDAFSTNLTEEQLGHFTHYRRVRRAGPPKAQDSPAASLSTQSPSPPATANTPLRLPATTTAPTSTSSSTSSSAKRPSGSATYLVDKPLPALPTPATEFHNLHGVVAHTFKRNISNRYPNTAAPQQRPAAAPHNRNSSLSSFADSARFTSRSAASTRASSVASVSRNPSITQGKMLGEVVEEDEGRRRPNSPGSLAHIRQVNLAALKLTGIDEGGGGGGITLGEQFAGFWTRHRERGRSEQGGDDGEQQGSYAEDADDVGSHYDPFELDQLLLRTPNAASASATSSYVDVTPTGHLNVAAAALDVSSLSLLRRLRADKKSDGGMRSDALAGGRDVEEASVLAPPVELDSAAGKHSPMVADERTPSDSPVALAPPPHHFHARHLLLPSPSGFPTTPSLSPFVSTPSSSPLTSSHVYKGSVAPRAPAAPATGLSDISLPRSGPVYTLHRRRHVPVTGIPKEGGRAASGSPSSSPTAKLRLSPDAAPGDFSGTPVVGPGRPLYLEPLAGLGIDIENDDDDDVDDEVGSVVTRGSDENEAGDVPREGAQRLTVFQVRDQLRRAATSHVPRRGRRGAATEEDDCLTYYLQGSDGQYEDDDDDLFMLSRPARQSVV